MYLNCKTYYSFCYGTFSTAQLVAEAVEQGVNTLALTNINSTYDHWEFVKLCREQNIKPILGVEIHNDQVFQYILLAKNNTGLAWINEFLSNGLLTKQHFPPSPNAPADVFVIYDLGKDLRELKLNERIGIRPSEITRLFKIDNLDHYVIRQPVTVQDKEHYYLHCLLRAIDNNVLLSALQKNLCAERDETFVTPSKILSAFKQYPSIVTNTWRLLEACSIEMDFHTDKTKQVYGGSKEEDMILLEKLSAAGLVKRYGRNNKLAMEKLRNELATIREMNFGAYFHITYDFIRFADSQGYYHVGRGSGANSIVAYCLGITDVDPIELNLYSERFLNPERTSPPDFDIDFSHKYRDEVLDYIFKRYGKKHVALLGSCPTFKSDSIIRQLGKVYGLPDEEIKAFQRSGFPTCAKTKKISVYGEMMRGFPYNPSLHPCGILISERPIYEYMSLFMPPKGFPTALMDMFTAEDIGLNKFDVLSQRGLSHIEDALHLVLDNRGVRVDIHDFNAFYQDPSIREHVSTGNTIGCFYVESPAMRGLLRKLRCPDYLTLVAASSIIRPGVASSGMMRAYIERFHHPELVEYIHPVFEQHLGETYGVMVYQEDVMIVAHHYGGLSLGRADILRRAMSGKYRSHNKFNEIKQEFFSSALTLGRDPAEVSEVWRQMESFAGYSFNKAHSASFAKESYMSLHLKTHYPIEFMVAVINNFGGFYSRELYFMELLKIGGDIHLPCVNNSDEYTNIKGGNKVYVGLIHIKGLESQLVSTLLNERERHGAYESLNDFIDRTHAGLEQLNLLIRIGAFRFTNKSKKTLLWEANFLQKRSVADAPNVQTMFHQPLEFNFTLPNLSDDPIDDLYDQMEIMNFCTVNPFALVAEDPCDYIPARDVELHVGEQITMLAYFITRKHVVTKNADTMFFGTFVDSNLDWIDTVHFPQVAARYPLHTSGFYLLRGRVTSDFGVCSLEVSWLQKCGYKKRSYSG